MRCLPTDSVETNETLNSYSGSFGISDSSAHTRRILSLQRSKVAFNDSPAPIIQPSQHLAEGLRRRVVAAGEHMGV